MLDKLNSSLLNNSTYYNNKIHYSEDNNDIPTVSNISNDHSLISLVFGYIHSFNSTIFDQLPSGFLTSNFNIY